MILAKLRVGRPWQEIAWENGLSSVCPLEYHNEPSIWAAGAPSKTALGDMIPRTSGHADAQQGTSDHGREP